jgi:hypothetical protein
MRKRVAAPGCAYGVWAATARAIAATSALVYRLTGGATTASAWLSGLKITMLTTTGAKTGSGRTALVLGLPDGENMIVIASNFGRPHNPAW